MRWERLAGGIALAVALVGCGASGNSSISETTSHLPLGAPGCSPPSPIDSSDEVRGTVTGGELWGLLMPSYDVPIHEGQDIKIVWRMTGKGDLHLIGLGPAGKAIKPFFGPQWHGTSSWIRPGDEWGSAFRFPTAGCWDVQASRGNLVGNVYFDVQ